ncbi:MAG: type II toxin-antitoxin system prevent-host-death family antitoxin [Leptospiraceae bacterium]|nr:type II toxin-antitoxin system prevent-host-death family antitoxin [Leptospiraceae bacterium]
MLSVGIRELKTHLSQYIDLVKKGENILITEHNKVVAELKFLEPNNPDDSNVKRVFAKLISEKKMIPAKRKSMGIGKKSAGGKKVKQKDWWSIYQKAKEDK